MKALRYIIALPFVYLGYLFFFLSLAVSWLGDLIEGNK